MFLLDTNVLSALRRRRRHPRVERWLAAQRTSDIHISAITIGEIQRGIAQQERRDPTFARDLAAWLRRVLMIYGDQVPSEDTAVARRWGRLSAEIGHEGPDLLIASTALEYDLTVVTGNVRHFEPTGAVVLNPFQ